MASPLSTAAFRPSTPENGTSTIRQGIGDEAQAEPYPEVIVGWLAEVESQFAETRIPSS
jgi:hypothetical protein